MLGIGSPHAAKKVVRTMFAGGGIETLIHLFNNSYFVVYFLLNQFKYIYIFRKGKGWKIEMRIFDTITIQQELFTFYELFFLTIFCKSLWFTVLEGKDVSD